MLRAIAVLRPSSAAAVSCPTASMFVRTLADKRGDAADGTKASDSAKMADGAKADNGAECDGRRAHTSAQQPQPSQLHPRMQISTPHPLSKLRQLVPTIPNEPGSETAAERVYRERLAKVNEWHHLFWVEHNQLYSAARKEFVEEYREARGLERSIRVPPDDLASFYKSFLDGQRAAHAEYNWKWWKFNLQLTACYGWAYFSRKFAK